MDVTGQEPENADTNASTEAAKVDSEAVEVEGAEPATAAVEPGKSGKPPHSEALQDRFDKLTREKYEGLSRAERAEYRAQLLEQQLNELKAAKTETVAPSDEEPTLESCGWDETDFKRKLLAYHNRQSAASSANVSEAVRAQLAAEREAERQRQADLDWERHEAEFIKSKPDYTEKVLEGAERRAWACSKEMAEAIKELRGVGPEVLYYLADNAAKSLEIARLPAGLQRVEIGRIAGRLEAAKTTPPPVSKAPPPATRIDAADTTSPVSPDSPDSDSKWDADEWAKRRNRQLEKRRG